MSGKACVSSLEVLRCSQSQSVMTNNIVEGLIACPQEQGMEIEIPTAIDLESLATGVFGPDFLQDVNDCDNLSLRIGCSTSNESLTEHLAMNLIADNHCGV